MKIDTARFNELLLLLLSKRINVRTNERQNVSQVARFGLAQPFSRRSEDDNRLTTPRVRQTASRNSNSKARRRKTKTT